MPFTIPNLSDAHSPEQAEVDSIDFEIIINSLRNSVISGCVVTAQSPATMSVNVSAGNLIFDNSTSIVSPTSTSVQLAASNTTYARFSLITADNTGTIETVHGTAATIPEFPSISSNVIVLAAIYVAAGATSISSDDIVDKRVIKHTNIFVEDLMLKDSSNNLATINYNGSNITLNKPINISSGAGGTENEFFYYSGNAIFGYKDDRLTFRRAVNSGTEFHDNIEIVNVSGNTATSAVISFDGTNLGIDKPVSITGGITFTGTIAATAVPDLDADKITTGEFGIDRIPIKVVTTTQTAYDALTTKDSNTFYAITG